MKNQTWLVAKNIYRSRVKGVGFWALVLSPFFARSDLFNYRFSHQLWG